MFKVILEYGARVHGLHLITFPAFIVKPDHQLISAVEVSAPNTGDSRNWLVHINIEFAKVPSEKEATIVGYKFAGQLVDRLSFDQRIGIDTPVPTGGKVWKFKPDGTLEEQGRVFASQSLGTSGYDTFTPDPGDIKRLSSCLAKRKLRGEQQRSLVRRALPTESIVDRFLQLYRILLDKCGSQTKTDKWLKKPMCGTGLLWRAPAQRRSGYCLT
jgi:hypothetical protein